MFISWKLSMNYISRTRIPFIKYEYKTDSDYCIAHYTPSSSNFIPVFYVDLTEIKPPLGTTWLVHKYNRLCQRGTTIVPKLLFYLQTCHTDLHHFDIILFNPINHFPCERSQCFAPNGITLDLLSSISETLQRCKFRSFLWRKTTLIIHWRLEPLLSTPPLPIYWVLIRWT